MVSAEQSLWLAAVADDAEMLSRLHAAELDAATWGALHAMHFPNCLGLLPESPETQAGWKAMSEALRGLPTPFSEDLATRLAADFASIYCNNRYHANPHASAWLDEDGLLYQRAMFDLRAIYASIGVRAQNWRHIAEDHLAAQLHFTALLARSSSSLPPDRQKALWRTWGEALEVYLLSWIKPFTQRISDHAELAFYPALAALTWAWCEVLRNGIAVYFNVPRLTSEELYRRLKSVAQSLQNDFCGMEKTRCTDPNAPHESNAPPQQESKSECAKMTSSSPKPTPAG